MSGWTSLEEQTARHLVRLALEEDLGEMGDITSDVLIPASWRGMASFVSRQTGVICGEALAEMVLCQLDPQADFQWLYPDGSSVPAGTIFGRVHACLRAILSAERTMLNFLQKLSGIATLTRQHVEAIRGLRCTILDTRKTTPGWRLLEKYAVRCGGGKNHRLGLYDGILVKDNHLAALRAHDIPISQAVQLIRQRFGSRYCVEIEADSLDQVAEALRAGVGMILLDNMDIDTLKEAVTLRNQIAPHVLLEASGGITLNNVRMVAETGVDYISIGGLTHSAPALDMALDYISRPLG